MSESDENHPAHPGFRQPEGVPPHGDEQTLPFVDLYSPGNTGGSSGYGPSAYTPPSDQYGAGSYGGGQYPHEQYGTPPHPNASSYPPQAPMSAVPQQQYGYYGYTPVEHPQATTVLVLALVGFVVPVTPFIAWYMGNKARAEIGRGAPYPYSGSLKVGHVIGKVLSILTLAGIGLWALFMIFYVVLMLGMFTSI